MQLEWAHEISAAFRDERRSLYEIARRQCGPDRAADVVQEAFLRLWNHPERFDRDRGSLRAYLRVMTRGVAIDRLRADAASGRRETLVSRSERLPPDDIDQLLIGRDSAHDVTSALAQLDADQRTAIEMAYFGNLTYRQVASSLGVAEGTIKSRIRVGLGLLRRELEGMAYAAT